YIDKEFKNIDRETFKQQLREAMKNLTEDYEVGLKKGRTVSVNRPINGAQAPKMLR
ncbi:transcriptional regulator, partial [Vibrio sp. M260118]